MVARKNALQVAQFMLHLLQLPINSKVNQGTNQQIPHREDDGAVFNNEERASPAPEREDTVDEGHEKLCARICEEVMSPFLRGDIMFPIISYVLANLSNLSRGEISLFIVRRPNNEEQNVLYCRGQSRAVVALTPPPVLCRLRGRPESLRS